MNLGVMLPGMVSGWLCEQVGYFNFFLIALAVSQPAFILVKILPFSHPDGVTAGRGFETAVADADKARILTDQ